MGFTIMQWNARGLISKWPEIKPVLIENANDVICIQESHFLPNDPYDFRLHNYTLYNAYAGSGRRQGGVCIYVDNSYPHFQVNLATNLQAVAVSVLVRRRRICICSLYLPPNEPFSTSSLSDLVAQLPQPFILCTDANSRNMLWGADRCDSRGIQWEQVIRRYALNVLNDGTPTRLDEYTGLWSHIDLTLSSSSIGQYMQWSPGTDLYSSDHCPIYINYDITGPNIPHRPGFMGWNTNKANWSEFTEKCELYFCEENGIDNCVTMTEALLKAAEESIPMKRGNSKYTCPWWNDACKDAIRNRRRALNRFRRSRQTPHLMEYKAAKARARRIIRQAKRDSWEKLLHMFKHTTPMRQLWDIIRRFTKKERYQRPLPVLRIGDVVIDDPKEVADVLGRFFSGMSASDNYRPAFKERERAMRDQPLLFASGNSESYNAMFTLDELKWSISQCGSTSIGPDRVHYAFFKHLSHDQLTSVLHLLNCIWSAERLPDAWKCSTMVPVLKPGKPPDKPESYRPIQLTSCFSKTMERMVTRRLSWFLEDRQMLSPLQCGFRKGRSTADHLIRLESEVRKGFFYNRYTLAVFLDFKNAYNLVSKVALLTKMHAMGFRGRMMHFIQAYLDNRTFQVRNGCYSDTFEQENGLVQGGVISPVLFNIMINDIFDDIPGNPTCALYADDCSLWVQGRRIRQLIERMQKALDHISSWADRWGFVFSPHKCNAIIFRRYMKADELTNLPSLKLYNECLVYSDEVKFLGVLLDTRLNLSKHIQYVKGKATKRIAILRCLAGRNCGADRTILLRIYKSMIRPILDYACHLLDGPRNKAVDSLDSVQNECLRIATGAIRTSPILPLLVDTNVFPLRLRRCELVVRYCMRVKSVPDHPCRPLLEHRYCLPEVDTDYLKRIAGFPIYERLVAYCSETEFDLPIELITRRSTVPPWQLHKCDCIRLTNERKGALNDIVIQCQFNDLRGTYPNHSFLYTDGSKSQDGVGCAYVLGNRRERFKLPDNCSVFTAEAVAVLRALIHVEVSGIPKCVICTDSLSVLNALKGSVSTHPIIVQIWETSHRLLTDGRELVVLWIPGHCNIIGNEVADSQAREAVRTEPVTFFEMSPQEYYTALGEAVGRLFGLLWRRYTPTTNLKSIKDEVGTWPSSVRNNRREEVVLCRMRLGHTRLTHGHILDREPSTTCDRCGCSLSVKHILVECPLYDIHRTRLVQKCRELATPLNLHSLLGEQYPDLIHEVFSFLRSCDLLKKF